MNCRLPRASAAGLPHPSLLAILCPRMHAWAVCSRAWGKVLLPVVLCARAATAQRETASIIEAWAVQQGHDAVADAPEPRQLEDRGLFGEERGSFFGDASVVQQQEGDAVSEAEQDHVGLQSDQRSVEDRRLFEAIEACPRDWKSFFTEQTRDMMPGAVVERNLAALPFPEATVRKRGDHWFDSEWLHKSRVRWGRALRRSVDGLLAEMATTDIPRHLQERGSTTTTTTTTTTTITTSTTTHTSTRTSTTLTHTTTHLFPCSICPLYHFLCPDDCTNCVAPGECRVVWQRQKDFNPTCDHRRSLAEEDACVDFKHVEMACPARSFTPGRLVDVVAGSFPLIRCRVCGLGPLPPDSSMYRGVWAGELTWGPNQFEAQIGETNIEAYHLHIVDQHMRKLTGLPVATVKAKLWANLFNSSHCDVRLYKASVRVLLPVDSAFFMVVPLTLEGLELKIGVTSAPIVDLGTLVLSDAVRLASLSCASWCLLFFQAWLALAVATTRPG